MADRSYVAQNETERARLRALIARLGESDLARPVGHGWTVAVTLAHLAFWDRRNLATLEEWERSGVRVVAIDPDPINDSMLPQWRRLPPRQAATEALAAAEAVDARVASLRSDLAEEIMAQRPRTLIRAVHRREHLDEIERALAGSAQQL